jgi:hypothetical protein
VLLASSVVAMAASSSSVQQFCRNEDETIGRTGMILESNPERETLRHVDGYRESGEGLLGRHAPDLVP